MFITVEEILEKIGDNKATYQEITEMTREAQSLIAMHTMGRSTQKEFLTEKQIEAIKEAIIHQIDYWIYVDPNMDMVNMPVSMKVDGTSLEYKMSELAPRAKRCLHIVGLLSRRIRLG